MNFADLELDSLVLDSLSEMGYQEPTAIQKQVIPIVLAGKDLIGLAETGSGKTAACAIPLCHNVDLGKKPIQVLIVVPTRELALQYATETQKIGKVKKVKVFAVENVVANTPITPVLFPPTSNLNSFVSSILPSTIEVLSGTGSAPDVG